MVALWRRAARLGAVVVFSLGICLTGRADQAAAANSEPPRTAVLAAQPIKACDLGFVPVKPIEGVGSIIGTAWAQCDVKPAAHVMTVSLDVGKAATGWR